MKFLGLSIPSANNVINAVSSNSFAALDPGNPNHCGFATSTSPWLLPSRVLRDALKKDLDLAVSHLGRPNVNLVCMDQHRTVSSLASYTSAQLLTENQRAQTCSHRFRICDLLVHYGRIDDPGYDLGTDNAGRCKELAHEL